jgi:hypothetical protein
MDPPLKTIYNCNSYVYVLAPVNYGRRMFIWAPKEYAQISSNRGLERAALKR